MRRILGIDPGSTATGFAVIEGDGAVARLIDSGVIVPRDRALPARLGTIFEGLRAVIESHRPVAASIEAVFMHKNASAALKLGQARGVAVCASVVHGVDVYEYEARLVKKVIVGRGDASKEQVQFMVARLLQIAARHGADEADAMALALCHAVMQDAKAKRHAAAT